jgi:hypothetical protein
MRSVTAYFCSLRKRRSYLCVLWTVPFSGVSDSGNLAEINDLGYRRAVVTIIGEGRESPPPLEIHSAFRNNINKP